MVEKTKKQTIKKDKVDFCISSSEVTDSTLTMEESDNLVKSMNSGPNEKAKEFSKEALKFYNEMIIKSKDFNQKS
ncbi:hypothetical protein LCGC14_1472650 [marine sediment metagenome]|uniref:Uncharacterized protein n=1 Tax=marine sediment metagenome TaxID=412755 RepID=A0A0F9MDQ5_9ZZZZ